MRRRWKVNEEFAYITGAIWFMAGFVAFMVIRTGEGEHLHRPPLSATAVVTLVAWLTPFALIALYGLGKMLRWLWSIRPQREWETREDARQAHKEGRL